MDQATHNKIVSFIWGIADDPERYARACARTGGEIPPLFVYLQVLLEPLSEVEFKNSLENLLVFLVGDGRTNANCWAVDLFFALSERWEQDWGERALPENFHDVLAMMGEVLHDTVKHPEIARDFGCLPEQLLERVRRLVVG